MVGRITAPVTLKRGGVIDSIVPGLYVSLGVLSQTYAYARSRGMAKVDGFVPQPRPSPLQVSQDTSNVRSHSVAGLLSVPSKCLGYSSGTFAFDGDDDEAYASSFLITASSVPSLEANRCVIGQVLDGTSMAFLERLASVPTKRGITGVLPGQTSGPPLLKIVVRETQISKVSSSTSSS